MVTPPIESQDPSKSLLSLLQRSLSWEYLGGSHCNPCCHPETDWRLLPFLVIVCPERGDYISRVKNEKMYRIGANEALIVPSGIRHTVGMPTPGLVSYAHIHYTVFGSMDLFRFFEVPRHVKGPAGAEIGRITHSLHRAMVTKPEGGDAFVQAVVRQDLAARLLRAIIGVSTLRSMNPSDLPEMTRMGPVLAYVEAHLDRPIRRSQLAEAAFLSETRFHYVFKQVVGVSPMAYVMAARMRKAQVLLSQVELTVTQIAEKVGFSEIFHFSKAFKAAFGISPMNYRRGITESLLGLYRK